MIKKILTTLVVSVLITLSAPFAFAEDAPVEGMQTVSQSFDEISNDSGLQEFTTTGIHPDAPADYANPGIDSVSSPILFAIDMMRLILGTIAVVVIIIAAVRQIFNPTEEQATESKRLLIWGTIGLVLVMLADTFVKRMFFGENGEIFEDPATANEFADQSVAQIRGLVGFINLFIGFIAVAVIIFRGITLMAVQQEEEALTKAKNQIIWAIVGLLVIGLSELVVRGILFPVGGERLPDVELAKRLIVNIVNYISGIIGFIAFVLMLYTLYRYITL